jgi:hypothetical protein
VSRLRPLTEAECYTRLYGDRESTVSVIREEEEAQRERDPLGEHLRRLFEERMDELPDAEAA